MADWYCCVAGFAPDNDFIAISKIIAEITDSAGNGMYGSTEYNGGSEKTRKNKSDIKAYFKEI